MSENGMEAYVKIQLFIWNKVAEIQTGPVQDQKTSTTMKNMTLYSAPWGKGCGGYQIRHQECENYIRI